jgi:tetratricopeptide (TPR) repeat protein
MTFREAKERLARALTAAIAVAAPEERVRLAAARDAADEAMTKEALLEPAAVLHRAALMTADGDLVEEDVEALHAVAKLWTEGEAFADVYDAALDDVFQDAPEPPWWPPAARGHALLLGRAFALDELEDLFSALHWLAAAVEAGFLQGHWLVRRLLEMLTGLLQHLDQAGRYDLLLDVADAALEVAPGESALLLGKGNALWDLGRPAEALAAYEAGLSVAPQEPALLLGKGNALEDLGRPAEALDAYEAGLTLAPQERALLLGKGNALSNLGRPAEALAAYQAGLRVAPQNPNLLLGKGNALFDLGRPAEALDAYEAGRALAPGDPALLHGKGNALFDLGRPAEALAAYEAGLAIDAHRVRVHLSVVELLTHHPGLTPVADVVDPDRTASSALREMFAALLEPSPSLGVWAPVASLLELARFTRELGRYLGIALARDGVEAAGWTAEFFSAALGFLRSALEAGGPEAPRCWEAVRSYAHLVARLVRCHPVDDARREALLPPALAALELVTQFRALVTLPGVGLEPELFELSLALSGAGDAEIYYQLSQHERRWREEARLDELEGGRKDLLRIMESFLYALAYDYQRRKDTIDVEERRRLLDGIHFYLELLPSYEFERGASRKHLWADQAQGLVRWFHSLTPSFTSTVLPLVEARGRLRPGELLVRTHWFRDRLGDPALLIFVLEAGREPRVSLRTGPEYGEDLAKTLEALDRGQSAVLDPTRSPEERQAAFRRLTGQDLSPDPFEEALAHWATTPLATLAGHLFQGVLTREDLQGRDVLLAPPVSWLALPWLAVPVPGDSQQPLAEVVRSLRLVPLLSLEAVQPSPAPARPPAVLLRTKEFTRQPETRRYELLESLGLEIEKPKEVPSDLNPEAPGGDDGLYDAILALLRDRTVAHVLGHLNWPPRSGDSGRFDLAPLVPRLTAGGAPLRTAQVFLETCNGSRVVGDLGEHFQSLTLSLLAAGVQAVLAPAYPIFPETQGARFFQSLYAALATGTPLPEAVRLASLSLRQTPDPLAPLPAFWAPFLLVARLEPPA